MHIVLPVELHEGAIPQPLPAAKRNPFTSCCETSRGPSHGCALLCFASLVLEAARVAAPFSFRCVVLLEPSRGLASVCTSSLNFGLSHAKAPLTL